MFRCGRRLVCALAGVAVAAAAGDIEARIQRVEHGLRPRVTVRGQLQARWALAERLKYYKVPGASVAVIAAGRVEWARGYGAVAENGTAVDAETLFQAASVSKPVSAMVALRLVDEGKLTLDEDVNRKLRSWKVAENGFTKTEKVTLRRLLNHSAGLTVHGFRGYAAGEAAPSLVEVLEGKAPANSGPIRVDLTPGTQGRYSGGGYEVMQQLVMDASGKPFAELARELVLGPLEMSRSTYEQPLPARLEGNAAAGHRSDGSMIKGRWHTYPEMAAAGLWTTPSDLARVALEFQSGGGVVLKPAAQRAMLTKLLWDYGLGIGLGETSGQKWCSHGGANEGFRCVLFAYLGRGNGAVIMTNGDRGSALSDEILRSISAEYEWVDYKTEERTVARVAAEILQGYAGRYALAPGFEVIISYQDGRLFAEAQGNKVELFPESESSFFAVEGEVPPIRFRRMSDQSVEMSVGGATAKRQAVSGR